jgi:hypothetical protein
MSRSCRRMTTSTRSPGTLLSALRRRAPGLAFIAVLVGCSPEEQPAPQTPITPAIQGAQNPRFTDTDQILSAELTASGAPTSYDAHFTNGQLTRIEESRARKPEGFARGDYEFQGARLLKYTGAPLEGDGLFALELDLQGRILDARIDERAASPEEVNAVRARAQLLRSHALAQSASRAHAQ